MIARKQSQNAKILKNFSEILWPRFGDQTFRINTLRPLQTESKFDHGFIMQFISGISRETIYINNNFNKSIYLIIIQQQKQRCILLWLLRHKA